MGNSFGYLCLWTAYPAGGVAKWLDGDGSLVGGSFQAVEDGQAKLGFLGCEWQATRGGSSNDFGEV